MQSEYIKHLINSEKSDNTIKKYSLAIRKFSDYVKEYDEILKEHLIRYKEELQQIYKMPTCNLYIIGLNQYIKYLGCSDLCIKTIKLQSQNNLDNCLTLEEYKRMLEI